MTHVLAVISPLVIAGDPLAGIAVGGLAGMVAAFLAASLLGAALNALRRLAAGRPSPTWVQDGPAADRALDAAA